MILFLYLPLFIWYNLKIQLNCYIINYIKDNFIILSRHNHFKLNKSNYLIYWGI